MRLDLFPLEAETDEGLLSRLMEECAEMIKEASKIHRFGPDAHPAAPPGTNNFRALMAEFEDVCLCMAEVRSRWDVGRSVLATQQQDSPNEQ